MMREAPFGHDGAAARHDAGDALRGQRHIAQPHARVDGEIVDALLALLDQRVLVDLPVELDGIAVHLLQRLIDRHRADRHGRVADDPFARRVDVAAGGKVHHRVGAPADRPHHLLHFLLHRGRDGGVADIRVHLGEEVAADDHRFEFGVVDVGGDDRAAARHLGAHKFRRDEFGDRRAEAFAIRKRFLGALQSRGAPKVLAIRDIDHLLGDDASACQFKLGDGFAVFGAINRVPRGKFAGEMGGADIAVVLGLHLAPPILPDSARFHPGLANPRQPLVHIDLRRLIRIRAARVVDAEGRLAATLMQGDFAEGDANVRPPLGFGINLARPRQGARRDLHRRDILRVDWRVHPLPLCYARASLRPKPSGQYARGTF